jgi:hypothetical protein
MTDGIQCPVCQYTRIPRDMDTCPQCDADLTCFRLLDRLSEMPPEPVPAAPESAMEGNAVIQNTPVDREIHPLNSDGPSNRLLRRAFLVLAAMILVLAVFYTFTAYRLSGDMEEVKTVIHENSIRLDRIGSRLSHLVSLHETETSQVQMPMKMPVPERMQPVPRAIQPVLILPKFLKQDGNTRENGNITGIDME